MERRLATILAADVVGYSAHMERDEEGTLQILQAHSDAINELISKHSGRVFGRAGDSVIAEFASPVEAVRCAVDMQHAIHQLNADLPEDRRLSYRIGVNLGDVIVVGNDLQGGGVNVAARLEALAPPGGLCISGAVFDLIRDQLAIDFEELGEYPVKNIIRPVRVLRIPLQSESDTASPFRGLDVFDYEHARYFHGRANAVTTAKERLEQQAAAGKPFLLIYGLSGTGKSSLVRAGLLPAITRPGAVKSVGLWRHCVMRPSEGPDPFTALHRALERETTFPEWRSENGSKVDFRMLLREAPEQALDAIRDALAKAAEDERSRYGLTEMPEPALALVVDQLEELFTSASLDAAEREAFVRVLSTWTASGSVWVIATLRGDFYHRCAEIPGLSELKDGLGNFELLPPDGPALAQMIRNPARSAGLRFEERASEGRLEDVLQSAAMRDPASLPLLQFVLEALFQAGKSRRLLTFADYRALGGLEGAIASRAEEICQSMPELAEAELPELLRALVTVGDGDGTASTRSVRRAELEAMPECRRLVEAFEAARLIVSSGDGQDATIRLAHEALVSHWPRARQLIAADRELLRVRARVDTAMLRWLEEDRSPDLLLPPGKPLAEAADLLSSWAKGLRAETIEYIEASIAAERAREEAKREAAAERQRIILQAAQDREAAARRLARRTLVGFSVAMILAVTAAFFGWYALERQAEADRRKAEVLRNQSLFLADQSQRQTASGNATLGLLLALEALPRDLASPDRPYVPLAEAALYRAAASHRELLVIRGHEDKVWHAAFSPDGRRLVTASSDDTARLWDSDTGTELHVLRGHEGNVLHAAFSPDGQRVVTVGSDATARLWNVQTGERVLVLRGHQAPIVHGSFSPDGRYVLTASFDKVARVWSAADGAEHAVLRGHQGRIAHAAFSPDGLRVVTSSYDGTARIWDARTGAGLAVLGGHGGLVLHATFSPDGQRLVTASADNTARLWDVKSGELLNVLAGHADAVGRAVFSPSGKRIATASADQSARVWDADSGEVVAVARGHEALIQHVMFSQDGARLVSASHDGTVRLWDADTGLELANLRGHDGKVWQADFSPDGRRIATASLDGTARIWDATRDLLIATLDAHADAVWHAQASPDGRRLATASRDGTAALWDAETGMQTGHLKGHGGAVWNVDFAPDGEQLVTASEDATARIWDVETGTERAVLKAHRGPVLSAAVSPRGDRVATASQDSTARLWDLRTGTELVVLRGHEGAVGHIDWSAGGRYVVTASGDHTARVWDADSGAALAVLRGHGRPVIWAEFSRDGERVVTTSLDGTVRIWDAKTGTESKLLGTAAHGGVGRAVFSADGRRVLTAAFDGTARIWDAETGEELVALRGHDDAVMRAGFNDREDLIVTASGDHTARIWSATTGVVLAVLRGHRDTVIWADFANKGRAIVTASADGTARLWRVLPSGQELIDYARSIAPRQLTTDERRNFYLSSEQAAE